jgi:hypothetical protein
MPSMLDGRQQVVTGVVPPQVAEALIRRAWPSVAAFPAVATLGRVLIQSFVGAPLGWALMLPFYFKKVLPFLGTRYALSNRRVMIQRGLSATPAESVNLSVIDGVQIKEDANSEFFRAATLEIISQGKTVLTLPAVPGPQAFRHAILNACKAWQGVDGSVHPGVGDEEVIT